MTCELLFPHLPSTTICPSESLLFETPVGEGDRDLSLLTCCTNEALDLSRARLYCS